MDDVHSFVDAVEAFWGHIAAVGWGALLLGCLMHVFRLTARVRAWQNIIRAAYPDARVPFRDVFCAYWAGVGVNSITPARGGDIVKLYIAKHRVDGTTYPTLASSLLVETLFDLVVGICMLLAAVQLGLLPGIPDLPRIPAFDWSYAAEHRQLTAIFFFGVLLCIVAFSMWATKHVVAFKQRVKLGFAILGDFHEYLTQVVSWQALSWGFRVATIGFFLRAFHIPVDVGHGADRARRRLASRPRCRSRPAALGTTQAVLVFALRGRRVAERRPLVQRRHAALDARRERRDRLRLDRRRARDGALARARPRATGSFRRKQLPDRPGQGLETERLGEERVGDLGPGAGVVGVSREERDAQLRVARAQPAGDLDAVLDPEAHVQEERRNVLGRERGVDLGSARRLEDPVAVVLEIDPAEEAHRRIVVCDENRRILLRRHAIRV